MNDGTESVRHHFAHLRREPEKMHALRQVLRHRAPHYDEMEYHPHQFVSMVENGRIDELLRSTRHLPVSELLCLRGALSAQRRAGKAHRGGASGGDPRSREKTICRQKRFRQLLDDELPQQAITSAFRKYKQVKEAEHAENWRFCLPLRHEHCCDGGRGKGRRDALGASRAWCSPPTIHICVLRPGRT